MDHVNKTLILSLKQDICSLNETIENIKTEADIRSWLYPTKNYKFVKDFIEANRVFKDDNVKLYLELIIDRLYVGLRLILSSLEKSFNDRESHEKCRFVQRPHQITIGCCFKNLWNIVEIFMTRMTEDEPTTTNKNDMETYVNNKVHMKTQTDISTLNKCDSCSSAMMCMKNLLTTFENETKDKMFLKRKIRPKIFDITQFGCMLETTTTIENSLNTLFQKLVGKDLENKELRSTCEKLAEENNQKVAKIAQLEQEVKLYKEKHERDLTKITLLRNQQGDLLSAKSKDDKQIEELKYIIINMKESATANKTKIQKMATERDEITTCFENMWNLQKKIVKECNLLQKKLSIIEKEQCLVEDGFKQFQITIHNLNKKLNDISKCHTKNEFRIQNMSGEINDMTGGFSSTFDKLTEYKENIKQKLLENCIREVESTEIKSKFQIKGNPVEDISRQIVENNEKIRKLNDENKKLEIIISKFKCIKK